MCFSYRKSSIKLPGAYLILDTPEGGLLEGGLLERGEAYSKSKMKRIYMIALSVFLTHILRVQDATLRELLRFDMCGGLDREGALFKILAQRGGAY